MANSNPCAAMEDDQRVEAAVPEEDAAAQLARSSNEHNTPEDHAAGELACPCPCITERSDARENNPREENGAALVQEDAVHGPAPSSLDSSSDVQKGNVPEKGAAADIPRFPMDRSSEAVNNAHADAVKGIASVLGPVMNHFDSAVEGALKSQSILATSIDRLTRELDKLLEDVPIPFATHHATRLSGIRKRVLTLNTSLRMIQRRMETIQGFLAGYASKAVAKGNKERSFMENSNSVPHGPSPQGDALNEAISTSSAGATQQEDGGPSIHSEMQRQKHHDDAGA